MPGRRNSRPRRRWNKHCHLVRPLLVQQPTGRPLLLDPRGQLILEQRIREAGASPVLVDTEAGIRESSEPFETDPSTAVQFAVHKELCCAAARWAAYCPAAERDRFRPALRASREHVVLGATADYRMVDWSSGLQWVARLFLADPLELADSCRAE